jgi:large subunit ribosomal protein L37Ae
MAKRTKKVGSAGRFQARYGVRARSRVRNVELIQRAKHVCPNCGHQRIKRLSTSIWHCGKCGIKFAGGAYIPRTETGQNIEKMLKGEVEPPKVIEEQPEEIKKEEKTKSPKQEEKFPEETVKEFKNKGEK